MMNHGCFINIRPVSIILCHRNLPQFQSGIAQDHYHCIKAPPRLPTEKRKLCAICKTRKASSTPTSSFHVVANACVPIHLQTTDHHPPSTHQLQCFLLSEWIRYCFTFLKTLIWHKARYHGKRRMWVQNFKFNMSDLIVHKFSDFAILQPIKIIIFSNTPFINFQ